MCSCSNATDSPFCCGYAAQLFDYVVEVPTVVRHAWRAIWSDGTYPGLLRVRLLLLLVIFAVYLISPLDLLPEAVFGVLGLLDDLLLFLLLGFFFYYMFRRFLETQASAAGAAT